MGRILFAATFAALLLSAAPLRAQLVTNGTLNTDASGWTLGGGCGDEVWDGTAGNPPERSARTPVANPRPTRRRRRRSAA